MKALSLYELAGLPEGTRVVFHEAFDIFPDALVPAGTAGIIKENGLNEIYSAMLMLPDDEKLRAALSYWKGCIYIGGADPGCENPDTDPEWTAPSPLALETKKEVASGTIGRDQ